jgi:hypothetical protein
MEGGCIIVMLVLVVAGWDKCIHKVNTNKISNAIGWILGSWDELELQRSNKLNGTLAPQCSSMLCYSSLALCRMYLQSNSVVAIQLTV